MVISQKTKRRHMEEAVSKLGSTQLVHQGKYLGFPLVIGRSKKQVFNFIKDRLEGRIKGWKRKLLSAIGKEVVLKSVAIAFPTYGMFVFKLPKGLSKDICRVMGKF
ncbi:hypothetical protein ACH5RR_033980 [Cinchona calisaya]|uniref:Uncharacterized protein n=1 Tax=Cinchona calisaya TaxID=153742 RepID=A0ABD2YDB6_9GENT